MAAPMKAAEPSRDSQVKAREDAIKRKLEGTNRKNKMTALTKINPRKGGSQSYDTKRVSGPKDGFAKSDYGVDPGAAIPYQILAGKGKVSINKPRPSVKPKPKPKAPVKRGRGHTVYKVRKGDTLSGIGQRHNKNWRDIWDYNLKNRNSKTVSTLKKRGPDTIFRGGTFYIPR